MSLSAADITQIIRQGVPAAGDRFEVESIDGGQARCRMRYDHTQLRPGGTLSGPTIMALADAAMYAVIMARLGRVEMAVTQNLNINFLSKPAPADLIAIAEPLRMGKRSVVLDVKLFSEGSDMLVAHVTGIYALPSH